MTVTDVVDVRHEPERRPEAIHVADGRLVVVLDGVERRFHAHWLLDRSLDPTDADPSTRQRLYEPVEVAPGFAVDRAGVVDGGEALVVDFTDGRRRTFARSDLVNWTSGDTEAPPRPRAWERLDAAPTIEWASVSSEPEAVRDLLGAFHELGCFVITGTPTEPGSLHDIAGRFGRVSATNFGPLFDVVSSPDPDDLAYTSVGLSAHLDQPYRRPTPGLQFLHTLVNDAPGGESTVVDGLAAVDALRRHRPEWYSILCSLDIEWRYDIGSDVVVATGPMIDERPDGSLRQLRFSPRLDFAPYADPEILDGFYAARRWLGEWLNDPAHQIEFKMRPGDVLVVDNHRVLHGRRPFDTRHGHRHLQGCYIDHDGPATMWRLLTRSLTTTGVHR